jgi:signal transduction histidine kinase
VEGRLVPQAQPPAVELVVADTGPGLPSEVLEQLLAGESTVQLRAGGSGLGLRICRTLVEANGGRLWAESEPGRGASFHFTLPVVTAEAPGETHTPPAAAGTA